MKIDEVVRAVMALSMLAVFCWLALTSTEYVDLFKQAVTLLFGYYIGSSSGSKAKDIISRGI